MDAEKMKELRELVAAATPGPYIGVDADGTPCVGRIKPDTSGGQGFLVCAEGWEMADVTFVAEALNALPALLTERESLLEENQKLKDEVEALTADAERWRHFACAQTALMLGTKRNPNDPLVDWLVECNELADAARHEPKDAEHD